MTDRERLLEILNVPIYPHENVDTLEAVADYLLDNGVTFQKWIPVSERLPEHGKWVLCACRAKIVEVLKYDSTMEDWDSQLPERCYMKGFVTHWMPLPEPPKEV
jgi:hypothetical protein